MAAGLNVCRVSQWTGFPSTGFRNSESWFGVITGFLPDGRVNGAICHPSARSAETAAGQNPAAMRTTIDERFMSELYQPADAGAANARFGASENPLADARGSDLCTAGPIRAPNVSDGLPKTAQHQTVGSDRCGAPVSPSLRGPSPPVRRE